MTASNPFRTMWEIVCHDGQVRHLPYVNGCDAAFDADLCEERGCNLYGEDTDCPGGRHRVRQEGEDDA